MLSIRKSAFETNSSSVHALIISEKMPDLTGPLTVHVSPGVYGWGWDTLTTPDERASYLYTAMCCVEHYADDPFDELADMLAPWNVTVLRDCGPTFTKYGDTYYFENGEIDHCEEIPGFVRMLKEDPSLALRFIFSEDSIGLIGNDNNDYDFEEYYPSTPYIEYVKGN